MKTILFVTVLISAILLSRHVEGQTFVGPAWQSQTNTQKSTQLTTIITNDTTPGTFPTLGLAELFIESMDTSFDTVADDLPKQFGGLQRRPKLIHSVGAVANGAWVQVPSSKNYTGVFTGCSNLIVRFSTATAPSSEPRGYVPAVSVKCLRTGVESGNIFGMYSLEGQDSWNFFKHDLTNHPPELSSEAPFALKEIRSAFAKASAWPTMLGLADFATYDENGVLASPVPSFPFRLIFHPYTAVHNAFPDAPSNIPFEQVLANTLRPGLLYYVYAQDQPTDTQDKFELIGRIQLTSSATTSNFGDKFMFFQHSRMDYDLALHPEWVGPAKAIVQQQQSTPYYTFPDLPFN